MDESMSVVKAAQKELEKTKTGLTFFKKEMKSLAVWIGSKSVIGKMLYVLKVCC